MTDEGVLLAAALGRDGKGLLRIEGKASVVESWVSLPRDHPGGLTDVAKKVEEDLLRVDLSKASSTGVSSTSSNGAFVAAVELAIGIHVDTVVIQTGEDLGEVQAMVVTMMVVAMMVTVMVMMMRGRSINHI